MITEKQERVLKEIIKYKIKHGISPTVRELAKLLEIKSTATVHGYLNRLEENGYITRHATQPRTIIVLKEPNQEPALPVEQMRRLKELLNSMDI